MDSDGRPRGQRVLRGHTAAGVAGGRLVGVVVIHVREGNVALAGQFWQMVGATFVEMAAYGVALGALIRNQVAAVVGVLVWIEA